MKKLAVVTAASLAGGIGIGVGQGLVGTRDLSPAWAQSAAARSSEEQSVIHVVKQARPAVVSVKREGGQGSGVIIRQDGVILTNAHVVGKAAEVNVELASGKELKGQVMGVDPTVDIAVVKVSATGLPEA